MLIQSDYKLRVFDKGDLEAVVAINRACLPENYAPNFFIDAFNTLPQAFIVAESQDRIVGYIMCRVEHGFSDQRKLRIAKKGHIISVAVMPDYRNHGVGRSLVEETIISLSNLKAEECYLEVRTSNETAIRLYEKLGFQITRTIHQYYFDGSDAFVMSKALR